MAFPSTHSLTAGITLVVVVSSLECFPSLLRFSNTTSKKSCIVRKCWLPCVKIGESLLFIKKSVHSLEQRCCGVLIETRPSCCSETTHGNSESVICLISQTEGMWFSAQVGYINVLLPAVIKRMKDDMNWVPNLIREHTAREQLPCISSDPWTCCTQQRACIVKVAVPNTISSILGKAEVRILPLYNDCRIWFYKLIWKCSQIP